MDPGAGVDLHCKLGEQVNQGEPLYTIHAEFAADFRFACETAAKESGYRIGAAGPVPE
jgi:thymidine phosphorylase